MSDFQEITSAELCKDLEAGKPVRVLDVRGAGDRSEWWIPGSAHAEAHDALRAGDKSPVEAVVRDWPRDVPVVAVCGQGNTSKLAAQALASMGFDAYSLVGGMKGWSEAWNTASVKLPAGAPEILQVRRTGKGCLSYMIVSSGEAAVVDACLPAQVYEELAAARKARIIAVFDTHVHADHVSRARALGARTGARYFLPPQDRVKYPFTALADGQEIPVGKTIIRAMHTPGHTYESYSYMVGSAAVLTGDTLFVKGVGRPDLKAASGDESRERAKLLYRSLTARLFQLDPSVVVLPGHTSEPIPFDGVAHAATMAEARSASRVEGQGEEAFATGLLAHIPADPPNHMLIVQINEGVLEAPPDLSPLEAGANRCAVQSS